ncbi:hypothetical protein ACIP5Y_10675 [Nocardia sp. NPDC088792]|uniref:hypothetical protein n=1 Tax=Nocardia sp. NPDC088792 TaxID=3364332 RepID=UPI0038266DBD
MKAGLFWALAAMLSLSGCGADRSGQRPDSVTATTLAVQGSYRDALTPEARQLLAADDAVRILDPCGFIDYSVVERTATPTYIGTIDSGQLTMNTCNIFFGEASRSITVTILDRYSGDTSMPGTPILIGDTTARMEPWKPYGGCDISIQLDTMNIRYHAVTSLWPEKNSCESLSTIVEASAHLVHTRPLREDSANPSMRTKLSRIDPCGVLDILRKTYPIGPGGITGIKPGCTFQYQPNDHPSKTVVISFGIAKRTQMDTFHPADPIDGVPIMTQSWNGGIGMMIELGSSTPVPVMEPDGTTTPEFDTADVECTGQGSAELVHAITEAMIELYHETP